MIGKIATLRERDETRIVNRALLLQFDQTNACRTEIVERAFVEERQIAADRQGAVVDQLGASGVGGIQRYGVCKGSFNDCHRVVAGAPDDVLGRNNGIIERGRDQARFPVRTDAPQAVARENPFNHVGRRDGDRKWLKDRCIVD